MSKLRKNSIACAGYVPNEAVDPYRLSGLARQKRDLASPYIVTAFPPSIPDRLRFNKVENAIFLKTKEISTREQMEVQVAMVKAIEVLTQLTAVDVGGDTKKKKELDARGRPIQKQGEPQDDDSFLDLDPNKE